MKKAKQAISAFPTEFDEGMTLRDYFAAKAMSAYIAAGPYEDGIAVALFEPEIASMSWAMADAMIRERTK